MKTILRVAALVATGVLITACGSGTDTPLTPDSGTPEAPSAIYTMNNDPLGNKIFVYTRADDGSLTSAGTYATGGTGTGASLGDQGPLAFDATTNRLFVVNPGDSTISMLALASDGSLTVLSHVDSGGFMPVSLTEKNGLVYVLNAGGTPSGGTNQPANISGFRVSGDALVAISGSTQPLSAANPGPAEILFSPDGKQLVVTEKGTNTIDTYAVDANGVASPPLVQSSVGAVPYGFAFSAGGQLIVSEAAASTVSSYALASSGALTPVTSSAATQQQAACWIAVAGDFAYAANAHSDSLSGFRVGADGSLTPVSGDGVTGQTGQGPIEEAATPDHRFLYVLNSKDHSLSIFAVNADGTLGKKPDFTGLPATAAGVVAR